VFIGTLSVDPRRKELCDRFGIRHMTAFGADYVIAMKKSKICFNKSMSNDINAKYFEIMGSGSFLLTNYNEELLTYFDNNPDLRACMYTTEDEIGEKIQYYLEHEDEREAIAKRLYDYVWSHHTWEARCKQILQVVGSSTRQSWLTIR
jgi:spore maturation protein CgeB